MENKVKALWEEMTRDAAFREKIREMSAEELTALFMKRGASREECAQLVAMANGGPRASFAGLDKKALGDDELEAVSGGFGREIQDESSINQELGGRGSTTGSRGREY